MDRYWESGIPWVPTAREERARRKHLRELNRKPSFPLFNQFKDRKRKRSFQSPIVATGSTAAPETPRTVKMARTKSTKVDTWRAPTLRRMEQIHTHNMLTSSRYKKHRRPLRKKSYKPRRRYRRRGRGKKPIQTRFAMDNWPINKPTEAVVGSEGEFKTGYQKLDGFILVGDATPQDLVGNFFSILDTGSTTNARSIVQGFEDATAFTGLQMMNAFGFKAATTIKRLREYELKGFKMVFDFNVRSDAPPFTIEYGVYVHMGVPGSTSYLPTAATPGVSQTQYASIQELMENSKMERHIPARVKPDKKRGFKLVTGKFNHYNQGIVSVASGVYTTRNVIKTMSYFPSTPRKIWAGFEQIPFDRPPADAPSTGKASFFWGKVSSDTVFNFVPYMKMKRQIVQTDISTTTWVEGRGCLYTWIKESDISGVPV